MSAGTQHCPLCGTAVPLSPRYPESLCRLCGSRAVSTEGRPLRFEVETPLGGGFIAYHADDGSPAQEVTNGHIVFVDGTRCWAEEHRFGGHVIQRLSGDRT